MSSKRININIGLLGHVDSGKTSLAKCLSEISSTACFDKHPQAQERGITIDLGFSSFSIPATDNFRDLGYEQIQFTLVDCPGHASLIRTIIGGIHIIDVVILVVDVIKGLQTQTAECLVISQITKKPLLVVLNKIDLLETCEQEGFIKKPLRFLNQHNNTDLLCQKPPCDFLAPPSLSEAMKLLGKDWEATKKINQALADTFYKEISIIPIVAKEGFSGDRGIHYLIEKLKDLLFIPNRITSAPFVLAIDHCFLIKGKGTVLTGTVLQGSVKQNDDIEIPILKEIKKVKSIQVFKQDVSEAFQGDRIGVCVKQFEPHLLERGVACRRGYIEPLFGVLIVFNRVNYFKGNIFSNSKYHISIGHETVIGKIKLFSSECYKDFDMSHEYAYIEKHNDEIHGTVFALIEFEKAVFVPPDSLVIGSKLDFKIDTKSCRLAYYGNIVLRLEDKNYTTTILPKISLFTIKEKNGIVQNALSETEIIGYKLCKKHSSIQKFVNFKVTLSTGETGYIQGPFGQKDKVRIIIHGCLQPTTLELLSVQKKNRKTNANSGLEKISEKKESVKIKLLFKKYLFDKNKKVSQNLLF